MPIALDMVDSVSVAQAFYFHELPMIPAGYLTRPKIRQDRPEHRGFPLPAMIGHMSWSTRLLRHIRCDAVCTFRSAKRLGLWTLD